MSNANARRYSRLDILLPVQLRGQRTFSDLITSNISRQGLFLRTERPLPERQLIKLHFSIPDGETIEVIGMVVHQVLPSHSSPTGPGMGIRFFAMSKEARRAWDRFCIEVEKKPFLRERFGEASDAEAPVHLLVDEDEGEELPTVRGVEVLLLSGDIDERRDHPRYVASFQVLLSNAAALRSFYTRDISVGGTFVRTSHLREPSDLLELVLLHPESHEKFTLAARVVRTVTGPTEMERGMALEFHQLDDSTRDRLEAFIHSGIAHQQDPGGGLSDEPILELEDVVTLDTRSPRAHTALGQMLLEQMEDPAAAIEALERALEIDHEYLAAHRLLRLAYALDGQVDKAFEHLRIARRLQGRLAIPI